MGHAGPDGPVLLCHLLAAVIFHCSSLRDDRKTLPGVLELSTNSVPRAVVRSFVIIST